VTSFWGTASPKLPARGPCSWIPSDSRRRARRARHARQLAPPCTEFKLRPWWLVFLCSVTSKRSSLRFSAIFMWMRVAEQHLDPTRPGPTRGSGQGSCNSAAACLRPSHRANLLVVCSSHSQVARGLFSVYAITSYDYHLLQGGITSCKEVSPPVRRLRFSQRLSVCLSVMNFA